MACGPPYTIQCVLKSPRTIISLSTILIVCYSKPYIAIWGLLLLKLQILIILIQPLFIAIYTLAILGLIDWQLYAYMLIYQLIRKYAQVTRSSLYRKQYPFGQYIFQVCLLYTSSYRAIIQCSFRLKLLNRGYITLQFKCLQLYCTIISPFIAYLVTYRCPPFVSKVSWAGLQQLKFFTRIGLWPHQYFLIGILLPVLLLVGQMVLLLK